MLAEMGRALRLKPSPLRAPERVRLADLMARRDDLSDMRRREANRIKQARDAWIRKDIKTMLRVLERRLTRIEAEINAQIEVHEVLARDAARLRSMPGIGPILAASLVARLPELGRLDRRAIASLAGLAPHACDSGVFRGKRRGWGGRAEVRRSLYLGGFIASRYDPRKLDLLMGLVALAIAWAGPRAARNLLGPRWPKRKAHGYLAKSWFRTGFDQIRHFLRSDPLEAIAPWLRIAPKHIKISRVV